VKLRINIKITLLRSNVCGILKILPRPVFGKNSTNNTMVTILGIMDNKKIITDFFMWRFS
jgi:hypothetical protein